MKKIALATATTALIALETISGGIKPATANSLEYQFYEQESGEELLGSVSLDNPILTYASLLSNNISLLQVYESGNLIYLDSLLLGLDHLTATGNLESSPTSAENVISSNLLTLVTTASPGNDNVTGEPGTDILLGRTGNDRLLGVNPGDAIPGQGEIDVLFGGPNFTQEGLSDAPGSDLFILGDENKPYYAGNTGILGTGDFAFILDFQASQDFIRLNGTPNNYRLANYSVAGLEQSGTAIFLNNPDNPVPDLIALLPTVSGLTLDGNYFDFDNTPPPPQPALEQIQQLGTANVDIAFDVATDSIGNVYTTGFTNGDLGGANAGSQDAWLAKYNSSGNQEWIQQLGTVGTEFAFGIAVDSTSNVYITGRTTGELGGTNLGGDDVYLAKFDTNGNQLWIKQLGSASSDFSYAITVDSTDNVYITGHTIGDLAGSNAGAVLPIPITTDVYTAKFDSNGNQLWINQFGTVDYDESYGVAVDSDGNVFTTGWTLGDLGGSNAGLYDGFLTKLNSLGELVWTQQFGTSDFEFAWDVAIDNDGFIYSTGFTLGNLGGANAGLYDGFLAKYDTNGNQVWIQQFGTSGSETPFAIDIDNDGFIYLGGYSTGTLGGTNAGGDVVGADDVFLVKFDSNGNLLESNQFGSSGVDRALGIDANLPGQVYLAGLTDGSFGEPNAGSFDAWVSAQPKKSVPEPSALFGLLTLLASGTFWLPKRRAIK